MRVLLGPGDTASFPTRLARALADQGANCWVVNFIPHRYSAGAGKLGKARLWGAGVAHLASRLSAGGAIGRALAEVIKGIGQFIVFLWALVRVDAIVFVSSRSLLPGYLDLPIYRLLGKRVIRIFLGTDARPRYMTGWHPDVIDQAKRDAACHQLARRVKRQRARVRFMSRFADIVVDNPLCGHYQQRPYINWFDVGFPHDPAFDEPAEAEAAEPAKPQAAVSVLHSPSNPKVKGTEQIEAVIDRLKNQGVEIAYTRITGMPRDKVIKHLKRCDLVIDQLYSDSPMAGFASEAAAYGKLVIVGGYGWETLEARLGEYMPTNLLCRPDELETTLASAINERQASDIGQRAQAFLNGYWHHAVVAQRFAALLTGQGIDDTWWVDPATIDYWQGLGATDVHRMAVIKALVETCGIDALGLAPDQAVYRTIASWTEAE